MSSHISSATRRPNVADQKFRGGRNELASDVHIAVMGVTGAGKSSFISLLCDTKIEIGHNLQSCTRAVQVHACKIYPERTIYLIDTPGFDDTQRSDTEILRELAGWLTESYNENVKLNGLIYFHRISDARMQGSAKKNLLMFKKLCGDNALKNVILVTSMWDRVSEEEGSKREAQLIQTPEFWGWMISKGSKTFRHDNSFASAKKLLHYFLPDWKDKITLDLQQQMVDEKKPLHETGAGMELASVIAREREKFVHELQAVQAQMKDAIQLRDHESTQAIREMRKDYAANIKRLEKEQQELKINLDKLHHERYSQLEAQMKTQQETMIRLEQERHRQEVDALREKHKQETASLVRTPPRKRINVACRFYNTTRGCRNGDYCRFQHVDWDDEDDEEEEEEEEEGEEVYYPPPEPRYIYKDYSKEETSRYDLCPFAVDLQRDSSIPAPPEQRYAGETIRQCPACNFRLKSTAKHITVNNKYRSTDRFYFKCHYYKPDGDEDDPCFRCPLCDPSIGARIMRVIVYGEGRTFQSMDHFYFHVCMKHKKEKDVENDVDFAQVIAERA